MASWYIYSGAAGAATGADWANAKTTIAAAITAAAAGDTFYVAHDHAETQASALTLSFNGTNAAPDTILCVSRTGSVPPVSADLATTATVSTTGANAISIQGVIRLLRGIIFSAGNLTNNASLNINATAAKCQNCAFRLGGTGSSSRININSLGNAVAVVWSNCTVQFAAVNQQIVLSGNFEWKNTPSAITGATLPTTLMSLGNGSGGIMLLEGVDLSALGSGNTIVTPGNGAAGGSNVILKNCKLGASVTASATPTNRASQTFLFVSDSGATNYRTEKYRYEGTQTVETTIVRTGGASDGTTTIAWKLVTTANSQWDQPFEAIPIAIWNDSTSSVTVTVYGIWGGGAVPNNDDIWMDVEYLGSASTPQGSFATATKADNLATGTALTSDASTWGGSTTAFKMTTTFTPAQKGAIYIYIKAAAASQTFYIDPKPVLS